MSMFQYMLSTWTNRAEVRLLSRDILKRVWIAPNFIRPVISVSLRLSNTTSIPGKYHHSMIAFKF